MPQADSSFRPFIGPASAGSFFERRAGAVVTVPTPFPRGIVRDYGTARAEAQVHRRACTWRARQMNCRPFLRKFLHVRFLRKPEMPVS
jgi:hypothetical protein